MRKFSLYLLVKEDSKGIELKNGKDQHKKKVFWRVQRYSENNRVNVLYHMLGGALQFSACYCHNISSVLMRVLSKTNCIALTLLDERGWLVFVKRITCSRGLVSQFHPNTTLKRKKKKVWFSLVCHKFYLYRNILQIY